jgi:Thermostable hemolysin
MSLAIAFSGVPCTPMSPAGAGSTLLCVHGPHDPGRESVERFIRRVFARRFGARVQRFAPHLVCLRDPDSGEIVAAAGYRFADQGALFLERYLDQPIEQHLSLPGQVPVERAGIVEVGHLAAGRAGEGRRLIVRLAHHLAGQDVLWVVSTLTEELRHLFVRMGITPLALGRADATALGDQAGEWGSYYEHHPVVLAGQMQPALRWLQRRQARGLDA